MPATSRSSRARLRAVVVCALIVAPAVAIVAADEATLPEGVAAVWDPTLATHERSALRERICLNGLWRWQPSADAAPPDARWGFFKVPGCWPGISDWLQADSQTVFAHPAWRDAKLGEVTTAWYQREIAVPDAWRGRRIVVTADYVASLAEVFVDGAHVGDIRYPAGEADVTAACAPGAHLLSLRVVALPLKAVMMSFGDTSAAKPVAGAVARRGLCGDVWLASMPAQERIVDARIDTSVRRGRIAIDATLAGLARDRRYALRARVSRDGKSVKEFASPAFTGADAADGRRAFDAAWSPAERWDLHTPGNRFDLELSLEDGDGKALDAALPRRFGFRELWIDGRGFVLNGTRIHLSSLPIENAQLSAASATYAAARESLERLQAIGVTMVYTHHYGCEPGTHLGCEEILRAADDVGMLVAFSQPHFGQYDWSAPDADAANGYARDAAFYVRAAQDHPSVVFYAMSHNATGSRRDFDPDLMDGATDLREPGWAQDGARKALRAEAIVRRLDPSRIVYHHASGNLGSMITLNFYPNFVPIQELDEWFAHWSSAGVKPLFTCEYGGPFTWDWTTYRGWWKGERSFGGAAVPWEYCIAEWDAQFLGDRAFAIGEAEKRDIRFEAEKFRRGEVFHRWDYPVPVGERLSDDQLEVLAMYTTDNWRAFRLLGLSANSPWDCAAWWKLRDGVARGRVALPVDWRALQRPGFSPDYIEQRFDSFDDGWERADWIPTAASRALIRNNRAHLAFIAGSSTQPLDHGHDVAPGETIEKQLVVIDDGRVPVACDCAWTLALPEPASGSQRVTVEPGAQRRVPLKLAIPRDAKAGAIELKATFAFADGETQDDVFTLRVVPKPSAPPALGRVALFDPKGETKRMLESLGVHAAAIEANADLSRVDLLVIGKQALTVDGPCPDVRRVRDGLRLIVFEQDPAVLERRFGLRTVAYGLRRVFPRVPDHPLLAGVDPDALRDWRGEATLLPARSTPRFSDRFNGSPVEDWCGIEVTRLWRCGCRGNVASTSIEKPARGDFLPVVDGGFSLQYSPLLVHQDGRGLALLCQLDVVGRSEAEPAAALIARDALAFAATWKPQPTRRARYAGEAAGRAWLARAGIDAPALDHDAPAADEVLIIGPGARDELAPRAGALRAWLAKGGRALAIGCDARDLAGIAPDALATRRAEHIGCAFAAQPLASWCAGVGPADVHDRDPREVPLVTAGADVLGDGVLAKAQGVGLVLLQLAPWSFDYAKQFDRKRTFRRVAFAATRLLADLGVRARTPLLDDIATPTEADEKRWLHGLYLDEPEEIDDPYRSFGW